MSIAPLSVRKRGNVSLVTKSEPSPCPGDVPTIPPARPPIGDMIKCLAALAEPGTIEVRDEEPLPERPGL